MGEEKEAELLLGAWQKTVDVQQHFNQIEMEIRKTAVTIVGAVVGAAGLVAEKGMLVDLFGARLPLAACILAAGIVAWLGFGFMDYFWYHRLLRGSVESGKALEVALKARGICVDLTNCIGQFSPMQVLKWKVHSNGKMRLFYGVGVAILAVFTWGASSVALPAGSSKVSPSATAATKPATATPPMAPAGSTEIGTKKE